MSKKESDVIKKEIINLKKITYEDVAEAFSESLPELIIFLKKKIKEKENPKEKEVIKKKYSKIANLTYTGELNEIKNHFESIIKQNKNYEKTQIMNIKTTKRTFFLKIFNYFFSAFRATTFMSTWRKYRRTFFFTTNDTFINRFNANFF